MYIHIYIICMNDENMVPLNAPFNHHVIGWASAGFSHKSTSFIPHVSWRSPLFLGHPTWIDAKPNCFSSHSNSIDQKIRPGQGWFQGISSRASEGVEDIRCPHGNEKSQEFHLFYNVEPPKNAIFRNPRN